MGISKTFSVLAIVCLLAMCGATMVNSSGTDFYYHSPSELRSFGASGIELPLDSNSYFRGSGHCDGCHGFDATGFANVNALGVDVSPIERWRSSMMANSAKDPWWKAKVSHEVSVNPDQKVALESKCTSCHAPMGNHFNLMNGVETYTMDSLALDTVGQDGVSCMVCHTQSEDQLGDLNSGDINYDPSGYVYGPFDKLFTPPMVDLVGITPAYSDRINDAGICAGCHTLLTNSVDLNGDLTGGTFVEQATYHEWLNSQYDDAGAMPTTCQSCHMPRIQEPVVISANYQGLTPRSPYAIHELTGANVFMLKILKENADLLDIRASADNFDVTIEATLRNLQEESLELDLSLAGLSADSVFYQLDMTNIVGHKFPSGYPSRRVFVEFVVLDELNGDTIFQSGVLGSDFEINGVDTLENFEPHYDVINEEDEVQIYEIVMGDVNGDYTATLERAFEPLKDNRFTPIGFSTSHAVYDTTLIMGNAITDDNFNYNGGVEGSGTDQLRYHVPLDGFTGSLTATAKVYYQTLPPRFTKEMFSYSTPEIDTFKTLYDNADKLPTLVTADTLSQLSIVTGVSALNESVVNVYPNPSSTGLFYLDFDGNDKVAVRVWTPAGKLVRELDFVGNGMIELDVEAGIYLLETEFNGTHSISRIVVTN
ncbi:MAG: hypothetical protein ACI9P8_002047 [Bacteroidia bacterium]|jgi:hypothetical protein